MSDGLFIFDMGEVLILDGMNLPAIAWHIGVEEEKLERDYEKYDYPMMEGWMDTESYMRHLESEFGVKTEGNLFHEIYSPRTNNALLPVLEKIRNTGMRLVIGSNTFRPHVERIRELEENPLGYFDRTYFSHEMHLSKPSKAFFSYILSRENVSPQKAFFVDDREENTAVARSLGIKTFLYCGEKNDELEDWVNRSLGL